MNPLRSVLRSTPRLRPPPRPAFRPFQARPYYVQTARPATWSARLWFRADGTPRSKIRGLVITSVLSGLVYATWSTLLVVEALDYEHYLLSTLVHIQRVDYDYSTVPFTTSYTASVKYFAEMCAYLAYGEGDISPQMVDQFFADVAAFDDSGADSAPSASASSSSSNASISSNSDDATSDPDLDDKPPQQRRTAAHILILAASAAVHDILARSKGADATETAALVLDVMDQALLGLIALAEDVGEDVREQLRRLRVQIGGGKERERGYESGSESEVLG
ncbi:hypothetical protein DFH08DRAFT_749341 [Mycena albidolilacea]|uniref:Uncharacterized protein n=1 Tax=Mycena albidolilacea TaxID=1033008 RepID=A0AAD7EL07_9AGAR|nr:hypothetical protein DFH08DRAFT_749341 [Mycena albidolilacea]